MTDGATINWDTSAIQVAQVTLAGNRTFAAPTNLIDGAFYALIIIQDGTGSRTATFNSVFKFTGGTAPTLTTTANARDILVFQSNGTNLYESGRVIKSKLMFALVQDDAFVRIVNSNKGIEIDDNQYPKTIFTLWTQAEREAIGIFEVVLIQLIRKTKNIILILMLIIPIPLVLLGSWGTATAKPLDNVLFEDGDEIPSDKAVGDIKQYGLKPQHKQRVNDQANGLLSKYDWYVIRNTEDNTKSIPSDISTYRTIVRTKANKGIQIDNASTVDALKALYQYTEQDDGIFTRPLAEFPEEL